MTGWADEDPVGRDVDAAGVGFCLEALDRACGLELARDSCGGDGRLVAAAAVVGSAVVTDFDGLAVDVTELVGPRSEAVVGLERFVGREEPHAPAVMTVTSATASPTARRGDGERDARVTCPR